MRCSFVRLALIALLAVAPAAARSQEAELSQNAFQYVLDLGAGVQYKPKYPGADEYIFVPFPIVAVQRFFIPGFGQTGGEEKPRAFYMFPSFDFYGKRDASDSNDLTGTNSVDWALEVGLGAGYRYDWLRGTVEVRQGFNGHEGQVVELGMDFVSTPLQSLQLNIGPRLTWASGDYMDTYFGVTQAEAAASGSRLEAYDPGSSFKTAGIEARAVYKLTDATRFHVRAQWDRYIADAADSPIVEVGSSNQISVGAGLTYRFSFDLFN